MSMKLSKNALDVLTSRYLWPKKNKTETPEEMFRRIARAIAPNKTWSDKFYRAMSELEFLPNSPTLMNAGRKNGQLAACFVLPLEDDLKSIMDTLSLTALIHQSGGGTGFDFSNLRARNSEIHSSHGKASGPVGFLGLFNQLTDTIKQGGLRRGANMGILRIDHPDIREFITCKRDTFRMTNFNLSVGVMDRFIKAVKENSSWKLGTSSVPAAELFDLLCENAWHTGEPGIIFLDAINRTNPTPALGKLSATNPCGEQPLLPYEACNLGSINLNAVYANGGVNYQKLSELVEIGVVFLDRVIDVCTYPDPRIAAVVKQNRKIGLGVMGFADLLIRMNIPYGSEMSFSLADEIMEFIREHAVQTSQAIAKTKGPFPGYNKSLWKKKNVKPLRNATLTTVAPTGTISLIAGASAGIEPLYNLVFERNILDGQRFLEIHGEFMSRISTLSNKAKILEDVAKLGSIQNLDLPDDIKKVFLTARDISFETHVLMQAHFQAHSDSAVSKTINLPESATKEDVKKAFLMAHHLKCKGITVYRDKSRPLQAMSLIDCPDCARLL